MTAREHLNRLPPKARILCMLILKKGGYLDWLNSYQESTRRVVNSISNVSEADTVSRPYWNKLAEKAQKIDEIWQDRPVMS